MFDKDLRIFFTKSEMISMQDIAYMLKYFEPRIDFDFSNENVVFIPQPWVLQNIETDKDRCQF
jgi:hypothetical protein